MDGKMAGKAGHPVGEDQDGSIGLLSGREAATLRNLLGDTPERADAVTGDGPGKGPEFAR